MRFEPWLLLIGAVRLAAATGVTLLGLKLGEALLLGGINELCPKTSPGARRRSR